MEKIYKLTDQNYRTRAGQANETVWGEGVTHEAELPGEGDLCTGHYVHAYEHPLIAAFMNPIHANIDDPILWECSTPKIHKRDGQLKLGVKTLTTVRQIPLPVITVEQRVEIAIRCTLAIYDDPYFVRWAEKWLSAEDRSERAARAARAAAEAAARAVRSAVTVQAEVRAAAAAATAGRAAAWTAEAAAWAAAWAARAAEERDESLDLLDIIEQVVAHGL